MSTIDGVRLARLAVQKVADGISDAHRAEKWGIALAVDAIDIVIAMYTEPTDAHEILSARQSAAALLDSPAGGAGE